jgi:ATP synthase protein I
MLAHFASMARRSATVTAAAAAVMVAICAIVGGTKSLLGAAIATAIVALFFGISVAAVGWATRHGTQAMMGAAAGSYIFKILALVILFGEFSGTSAFSPLAFGATALVLVFAYDGSLILWWTRTKMLYVEPDGER